MAKAALELAKAQLKDVQATLKAAQAAAGLWAGTLAILGAEVAAAEATLAAAEAAASVAAVAIGGYTVGAAVSQLAIGTLSTLWETFLSDVPPPRPVDPTRSPIYVPPSAQQLSDLVTTLTAAAGIPLTDVDFTSAGQAGVIARNYIEQGTGLTIAALAGAAAAYAGRQEKANQAAECLDAGLRVYRATTEEMSRVLSATRAKFETTIAEALRQRTIDCAAARAC